MTWRTLIRDVQAKAVEHGDHVLDLPVNVGLGDEDQVGTGLTYNEPQAATEDDAAEKELLILETNWD